MQWKPEHDAIFLREVLASDLYSTRKDSSERGKIWSQLAEKLNEVSSCKFIVTQKSLRDRSFKAFNAEVQAKNEVDRGES